MLKISNPRMPSRITAFIFTTVFAGLLMSLSGPLFAALSQDPSLNWQTLYTNHFEIHFHDGEASLAQQVGSIAEQVHTRLTKKFRWTPQQRTQVVLTDRFDYANGSATPMPRNTMNLQVSPPTGNSVITSTPTSFTSTRRAACPSACERSSAATCFCFPTCCSHPGLSKAWQPTKRPTRHVALAVVRAPCSVV